MQHNEKIVERKIKFNKMIVVIQHATHSKYKLHAVGT